MLLFNHRVFRPQNHLCRFCRLIPDDVRSKLMGLRDSKRRAAGGKKYWAECVRCLGVHETADGLRLQTPTTALAATKENAEGQGEHPNLHV